MGKFINKCDLFGYNVCSFRGCYWVPSIGFSLLDYSLDADFSTAKIVVKNIINKILNEGLPKGRCLNVNIPKLLFLK